MKTMYKYLSMMLVAVLFAGCFEHEPTPEELPREAVSFTYLINGDYPLDYYVDSEIQFISTSYAEGTATWDFGDNSELVTGDVVTHAYSVAATYYVKLTITKADGSQVSKTQPLMISDIKPLMKINPIEGGLCEVKTSPVSFTVELPNPKNRAEQFIWTFPEGTIWADGSTIEGGQYKSDKWQLPQAVKFSNVGSQNVRLQASLDGRVLEEASMNVQVGYFDEVPTLYYAVKGGNVMALKLAESSDTLKIYPYDLGVSSGQHPFNLLFEDSTLFLLDAGKQFYYVDDVDGNLGDGKISAIAQDGSKVETVISNVGQAAFDDPFYGYLEDGNLYFANRNTGVVKVGTKERNKVYNSTDFPYEFQNATTNWYKAGIEYGCIGGTFAKIDGVWYWAKYFNGNGLFRFNDDEILDAPISAAAEPLPQDGQIWLPGMNPKSFVYNKATGEFFFSLFHATANGLYRTENIKIVGSFKNVNELADYAVTHVSGEMLVCNATGQPAIYEGTSSEPVGICQMALDEETGYIYFGYRPAANSKLKAGLMRYNPNTKKVETLIEGVELYGITINPRKSKLF